MLKSCEIQEIEYTKESSGETTNRVVIPTFVPAPNIKAIDVTDLSDEDRESLRQLYESYAQYVKERSQGIFSFEDWVSHTLNEDVTPKWRTFRISGIKEL